MLTRLHLTRYKICSKSREIVAKTLGRGRMLFAGIRKNNLGKLIAKLESEEGD